MQACKKSAYDQKSKKQFNDRFNVINTKEQLTHLVETLPPPEFTKTHQTTKAPNSLPPWIQDKKKAFSKSWSKQALTKTLWYVFHVSTSSLFVSIRKSKPIVYLITNPNMISPAFKHVQFPCKIPSTIRVKTTGCLINFELKDPNSQHIPSHQSVMCNNKPLVDVEWYKNPSYDPIFYFDEFTALLNILCKKRTIQDCDFIINFKDQVLLPRSSDPSLKTNILLPILSNCTSDNHLDIPIITPDEIVQAFKVHSISRNCVNPYDNLPTFPWKDRIPTAIFRGSATGCGSTTTTNIRIAVAALDALWNKDNTYNHNNMIDKIPFMDAGIVSWGTRRMKIARGTTQANYPNIPHLTKHHDIKLKEFVSMEDQRKYKYALYLEGNVMAYRLAYLFSTKSVVLYVESEYKPWFYDLLRDNHNCIFIKRDLSNLAKVIKWCKEHDKEAYQIATNGYNMYKKIIGNKDYILDYMQHILLPLA